MTLEWLGFLISTTMADFVPDVSVLSLWLVKYGGFILFIALTLGIIALPIPEETLMVVTGILMHKGKLNIPITAFFAYAGSICGITVSYLLGRSAGKYLLTKFGPWFGITNERLEKAHYWFERFGKWLLFIGYFMPGIRHLTGFSAGMTYMKYKHFAPYAYSGAIVWVTLFLSLGYFFGNYWFCCYEKLKHMDLASISLVVLASLFFIYYLRKRNQNF